MIFVNAVWTCPQLPAVGVSERVIQDFCFHFEMMVRLFNYQATSAATAAGARRPP
jgi:hypothetical protein